MNFFEIKYICAAFLGAAFCLAFFLRLRERGGGLKYIESFLFGVFSSLVVLLFNGIIHGAYIKAPVFLKAFLFAASVEKLAAFASLLFLLHGAAPISLRRGVVTGIIFAFGFSLVESSQYLGAYGIDVILPRMIFSLPMHVSTCGIMGYLISLNRYSPSHAGFRKYAVLALLVPLSVHGIFDYVVISGLASEYVVPVYIVVLMIALEAVIAISLSVPPKTEIEQLGLSYPQWLAVRRHIRHEKWINRMMGKNFSRNYLFTLKRGRLSLLLSCAFAAAVLALYVNIDSFAAFTSMRLPRPVFVMVFVSFPLVLCAAFAFASVINPAYFAEGLLRIPIISNVVANPMRDNEETFITYDISPEICFIKTFEPLGVSVFDVRFEAAHLISPIITVVKMWQNTDDYSLPLGMLIVPANETEAMRLGTFIAKYRRMKFLNGIFLQLKVPGYERIRKLFVHPSSVVRKHVFFDEGGFIYRKGDAAEVFYVVSKGKVGIFSQAPDGSLSLVSSLKRGESFGESEIIGERLRGMTAVALSDCELDFADLADLKNLVEHDPHFAYQMILSQSRRIHELENIASAKSISDDGLNGDSTAKGWDLKK